MRLPFGSYAWARRSDGKLTRAERLREALHGARSLAAERFARAARLIGVRPRAMRLLLDEIPLPRSPLVTASESALASAAPWVLGHSMRTYLWAFVLGRRDGIDVDAEVLLVASLLHDVGLVRRDGAACYALRGADQAREVVLAGGGAPAVADRIADAISAHLNVRPARFTAETRLLRAGAGLDVIGDRFEHVDPETRRAVVAKWSREGFATALREVLRDESTKNPETRIGFLCHTLGFLKLVADADRRFDRG